MSELSAFFSYTLRGCDFNIDMILKLKNKLKEINHLDTYFDILDNTALNRQEYVYQRLDEANVLCLIKSSKIDESKWASKEIEIAGNKHMPFVYFNLEDVEDIINANTEQDLLEHKKIREMLEFVVK